MLLLCPDLAEGFDMLDDDINAEELTNAELSEILMPTGSSGHTI
jgi:hypothetical protein